jgi:SAM-dependent methyltransferase
MAAALASSGRERRFAQQQAHAAFAGFIAAREAVPREDSRAHASTCARCRAPMQAAGRLLRRRLLSPRNSLVLLSMSERIREFVESMKIQPTDRVLEIGCGHGVAATLICQQLQSGSYVGVDRSIKMINGAGNRNERFVAAGIARFVLADLDSLDLGDLKFDKVLAMRVRVFHEQPSEATTIVKRWLAPHGKLFVQYDEPQARG